ncbi:MAG: response regulator [Parvibaculaceae bacterium]
MKILIADDHWVVRESLKQVIRRLKGSHVTLEAGTFHEAMDILRRNPDMDLVLVDLIMPGFSEFDGLKRLRREFPNAPVVVVSVHEDPAYVMRALESGVIGYVPKSASGPEVERAFELILAGDVYFPRRLIEKQGLGESRPLRAAPQADDRAGDVLTRREQEIVELLGQGLSVQRIAEQLDLRAHTVRVHLGNLMKKLGLPDRSAAIHYAVNRANTTRSGTT